MTAWAALEAPLRPVPAFPCEAPDGKRDWSEDARCVDFQRLMRTLGPRVFCWHVANEGKRNPQQARKLGIRAGVFDYDLRWLDGLAAFVEFKGYRQRRAGVLSDQQIEFGNRCVELGIPAAMFFDPLNAVTWLRGLGFPIREVR